MTSSVHQCGAKCETDVFNGTKISCSLCELPTYLGCIADRKETIELLTVFGLYDPKDQNFTNNGLRVYELKRIFGVASIFGYVCATCKNSSKTLRKQLMDANHELIQIKSNLISIDESSVESPATELKPGAPGPVTSSNSQQQVNSVQSNNIRSYSFGHSEVPNTNSNLSQRGSQLKPSRDIHVSKFQPNIPVKLVADHILERTSLELGKHFSLKSLLRRSTFHNDKTYATFKITAFDDDSYDVILNKDLWEPKFKAIPFVQKERKSKSHATPGAKVKSGNVAPNQTVNLIPFKPVPASKPLTTSKPKIKPVPNKSNNSMKSMKAGLDKKKPLTNSKQNGQKHSKILNHSRVNFDRSSHSQGEHMHSSASCFCLSQRSNHKPWNQYFQPSSCYMPCRHPHQSFHPFQPSQFQPFQQFQACQTFPCHH